MRGGRRLGAGVVPNHCRDEESGGFEEDFVETRIDFVEAYPVCFVFGFFLVYVPSEVGMFLFGLKAALAWRSAWARVGGAARVVGDGGKLSGLGRRGPVVLVRDPVEGDRGVPASCGD